MSERVICTKHGDPEWPDYDLDPDAPSVAEIVDVVRDAKAHINGTANTFSSREKAPMLYRLNALIDQLEDNNG